MVAVEFSNPKFLASSHLAGIIRGPRCNPITQPIKLSDFGILVLQNSSTLNPKRWSGVQACCLARYGCAHKTKLATPRSCNRLEHGLTHPFYRLVPLQRLGAAPAAELRRLLEMASNAWSIRFEHLRCRAVLRDCTLETSITYIYIYIHIHPYIHTYTHTQPAGQPARQANRQAAVGAKAGTSSSRRFSDRLAASSSMKPANSNHVSVNAHRLNPKHCTRAPNANTVVQCFLVQGV